jgi:hypothetical protein
VSIVELANPVVFAFRRIKGGDHVAVVVNLSAQPQSIAAHAVLGDVKLEPWGWRLQADAAQ